MRGRVKKKPDHWYCQSGVIPLRRSGKKTEVLLVTSRGGKRWIIPKGIIEPGLSAKKSALREAWEEAGAQGVLRASAGSYRYRKWGGECTVAVFLLDVGDLSDRWPEGDIRKRRWFSKKKAASLVREDDLRELILQAGEPGKGGGKE